MEVKRGKTETLFGRRHVEDSRKSFDKRLKRRGRAGNKGESKEFSADKGSVENKRLKEQELQ